MNKHLARERFRAILGGNDCIHPASVFDPLSARIAEDIGFELGMLAGSTAALSVLAAPDLIVLTLTELAEQARRMCRASGLPILVDADHGYGNHLNVRRTVEELDHAGVAALSIEDTLLPAPFGAAGKAALISVDEGVGKMRAAVDARGDSGPAILGRTSALQITGMADALQRLRAYEAAGVDGLFVIGVKSWEQLAEIRAAVRLPLVLGSAGKDMTDRQRLAEHGVVVGLQGHQTMAAMVQALHVTMRSLRDGVAPKELSGVADMALMQRVSRADDYERWIGAFGAAPT